MLKERLRDLDLNLLIVFEALLRHENVSRAADDLDMSQSAVSHALKRLRALFGDMLFVRSRDRMAPTPKAVELSGSILEIMRLTRSALLPSPSFDPGTSERALTIALGDVGDMVILPRFMQHLRENNAGSRIISLATTSDKAVELLAGGKLDIYVGVMEADSPDILCQKLYDDRIVFIASRQNRLNGSISHEEYAEMEQVALQSRSASESDVLIYNALRIGEVTDRTRIMTPHIAAVPGIVERDDNLISAVPASLTDYFQAISSVKVLVPTFEIPTITISQYWHRRFDRDPFNVWYRQALYRVLKRAG